MQKLAKKLSLAMVALLTVFTFMSYMPARAAVAAPSLQMVTQPAAEYKPGDRISFQVTSPNYGGAVEYRVMLWNGTTKKQSELWPTHPGYFYQNWKPSGKTIFTINWPATGMEPGAYSLTVLVRRANTKVSYDSFVKTNAFWIKSAEATISTIANVSKEAEVGKAFTMPTTVAATMSDNTTKEVPVTWTTNAVDTSKAGTYAVTGVVAGYSTPVVMTVNVKGLFKIESDEADGALTSDGADNAIITVTASDAEFKGTVKFISLKGASFAKDLVSFDKGVARVQVTSMSSPIAIEDTIIATIADAPGHDELVGQQVSIKLNYIPATAGAGSAERIFPVYAESDKASDIFVRFNKAFDYDKLVADWAKHGGINVYNNYVDQDTNEPVVVTDIVKVDDTTLKLVLLEKDALVDNSTITIETIQAGTTYFINGMVKFRLVDTKAPEAVKLTNTDYLTLVAEFTEPITNEEAVSPENWVLNGVRLNGEDEDGNAYVVAEDGIAVGRFEKTKVEVYKANDNRNFVTIKLTPAGVKLYKAEGKTNLLQAYNMQDYAALTDTTTQNKATTQEFRFATPAKPGAPKATITMDSPEQFRIKFDAPVVNVESQDPLTEEDFGVRYVSAVSKTGKQTWTAIDDYKVTAISGQEYIIELVNDWTEVFDTAAEGINYYSPKFNQIEITVKGVDDQGTNDDEDDVALIENAFAIGMDTNKVEKITMDLDDVSPTIAKATQVTDDDGNPLQAFKVVMSEPVQMNTGVDGDTDPLTPSQKQAAGAGIPVPTFQFVSSDKKTTIDGHISDKGISADDFTFTVEPESDLKAGTWTLYIRSISDDIGNTSSTVKYTLTVKTAVVEAKTQVVWADVHNDDGDFDIVHIQFGTNMSIDALRSIMYTINGKVLPAGVSITAKDDHEYTYDGVTFKGTLVTIKLPGNFLSGDNAIINIAKTLKDENGNALVGRTELNVDGTNNHFYKADAKVGDDSCTAE